LEEPALVVSVEITVKEVLQFISMVGWGSFGKMGTLLRIGGNSVSGNFWKYVSRY
jgi:hypothetical protein